MITKKMVYDAYDKGFIRLVYDFGIKAKIGFYSFWFGGEEAEKYFDPKAYESDVGAVNVKDMIFETLRDFASLEDFKNEYNYYEAYIKERLIEENHSFKLSKEIALKLTEVIDVMGMNHKQIAELITSVGHRELQSDFAFICMYYLKEVASDNYRYDARNEGVHKLAQEFINPNFKF